MLISRSCGFAASRSGSVASPGGSAPVNPEGVVDFEAEVEYGRN